MNVLSLFDGMVAGIVSPCSGRNGHYGGNKAPQGGRQEIQIK